MQEVLKKIVNTNKVYYDHLSKYGKSIGSQLVNKPEYEEPLFKEWVVDKPVLHQTIAEHMYRTGAYQAGEAFTREAEVHLKEDFKLKFKELNAIVKELKSGQLD